MAKQNAVEKVLTLSTAHMPSGDPAFGDIRSVPHHYGALIFLTSDGGQDVEPWLKDIYKFAVEQGCVMVMFDRDAEVVEGFATYEW